MIVVGAGPVGCEIAQAYARLGARVTLVETETLLSAEDPELVEVVRAALQSDGMEIVEATRVARLEADDTRPVAAVEHDGHTRRVEGSHLL